jgi:hypothetical protein
MPAILNFAVIDQGVLMPTGQLEQAAPAATAPLLPVARPVVPQPRVPVIYAPKQDRN